MAKRQMTIHELEHKAYALREDLIRMLEQA